MWIFLVLVTGAAGLVAGIYAWMVFQKLVQAPITNERVKKLTDTIHLGAMAFLKKEYTWLAPFVAVVA
ncbi:MAG: sodium-translocating pyrophosphatase, partial [Synergistaceae bacterium]|nr:sodium-translocating pyrophosphatase [Synergistaceae bacterium]